MTTRPISTITYFRIKHCEACHYSAFARFSDERAAFEQHNKCTLDLPGGCRLKRVIECELRTQSHVVVLEDTDRWCLRWLHDRLVNVHKESPNVGYMHGLRGIIATVPVDAVGYKRSNVSVEDIGAELDDRWEE